MVRTVRDYFPVPLRMLCYPLTATDLQEQYRASASSVRVRAAPVDPQIRCALRLPAFQTLDAQALRQIASPGHIVPYSTSGVLEVGG